MDDQPFQSDIYPREDDIQEFIDLKITTDSCFYCGSSGSYFSLYNSTLGLIRENIYIVCNTCKYLQTTSDQKSFLQHVYKIYSFINKDSSSLLTFFPPDFYYSKSDKLYKDYYKSAFQQKLPFELSEILFKQITLSDCFYCGTSTIPGIHHNGIDKINPTIGYIEGNVVPACYYCNLIKRDVLSDDFLFSINTIYNYTKDKLHLLIDSPFVYRLHKIKKDRDLYFGTGIIRITSTIHPFWGEVFQFIRYDNIDPIVRSQTCFLPNFSLTVEDPDYFINDINRKLFHLRINDSSPTTFKTTREDIQKRTKALYQFHTLFTRHGEKFLQYPHKKIDSFFEIPNDPVLDRLDSIHSILSNFHIIKHTSLKNEQHTQTISEHTETTTLQKNEQHTENTTLPKNEQHTETTTSQNNEPTLSTTPQKNEDKCIPQNNEHLQPITVHRTFSHGLTELQIKSLTEFLNLCVVKSPGQGCVGRAKLWTCYLNWCISAKIDSPIKINDKNHFLNYVCMHFFSVNDEVKSGSYITNGIQLDTNQGWRNYWIRTDNLSLGGPPDGFLGPLRTIRTGTRSWSDYSKFLNDS